MYKKEDLETKSLVELLTIYVQAHELAGERDQFECLCIVEKYILENFVQKPMRKLGQAEKNVDAMNFPDHIARDLKEAKNCAANIAEHLNPLHIDGMESLKRIIHSVIAQSEKTIENRKNVQST